MNEYNFDSITKTTALNYANNLCSRASTIINDEEIPDLLWRPYELKFFNQEEIRSRLNLLTPDRCITIYVSKLVENESDLSQEKWYGTKFRKDKIKDEFIARLSKIMPS
jgi:hypothetical protein